VPASGYKEVIVSEKQNDSLKKSGGRPASNAARWSARQLATMALFAAIGAVLSFIEIPLLGTTLKLDLANVPAIIAGLAYGPAAGCLVGIITHFIHAIFLADFVGAIMNIASVITFVVPAALIYRRSKTTTGLIVGLVVGIIVSFIVVVPLNFLVWPLFMGFSVDDVAGMMAAFIIPLNIIKGVGGSILAFIVFKTLGRLFTQEAR
jgi:riboflavin transporter FmnP